MDELTDVFAEPGSAYRGKPFWAWNGRLEAGELRRQIRVMHRMGLGGFFMHSRIGLATPYLSEEWFRMVEACVDEARNLGMEAWLYDEDRWPSGAAGGLVTCDPEYRHRNLFLVTCRPAEAEFESEPLALFSAVVDGAEATQVRRLPEDWDGSVEPAEARVLAFFVKADEPSSWYNDATYLDTLSHRAVRRFIELTHEAYRREAGEEFGRVVPGIFTDEPNHGAVHCKGRVEGREAVGVPWTGDLPERFRERYGYDVLDHLPELFYRVDGREQSQARWHYHDCKTFLFVDAFARQCYEWCEENGLALTGHVLAENTLRSQSGVGGCAMRFYEFMQAPGIDQLTEHWDEYTTARQCDSVRRQTGRRWMLSELYGCTGWDWPFEGHKAVGDWQAALGVNLRCQHLSWYTMSGQAKRDYPASISFQSPWWEHYSAVEDYYARINAVFSRGEPVRDLLVIHPVESVWARAALGWGEDGEITRVEDAFQDLTEWLLAEHLDFDYGDEEMLGRLGSVEVGEESVLRVGQADYRVVLVPPAATVRSSTLELLSKFADAGGTVVFCEPVPGHVDAEPSGAASELAAGCAIAPLEREAVAEAVEATRQVSIRSADGAEYPRAFYRLHRDGVELRLFICHRDRQNPSGELTVSVRGHGQVQLWDPETGKRWAMSSEQAGGQVRFNSELPPTGSRLFVITPEAEELPPLPALTEVRTEDLAESDWSAELTDHNVLVLDMPEYRLGDGDWAGPLEILKADAEIRDEIGLPRRAGQMVQPWARERDAVGPSAPLALRYRIQVEALPTGPVFLAIENPQRFDIALNGNPTPTDKDCGWWVDPCLRVLPLDAAALVEGENELTLAGEMDADCELEACFLLGAFSVAVDGAAVRLIGDEPQVGLGDWTGQGLPFYSGSAAYRTRIHPELSDGERLFVEVPEFGGACVRVLVDGHSAGVIGWQPHEVEITDLVRPGEEAELAVEVVSHRRNAFGPLHHAEARPDFVGPHTFVTGDDQWQDAYNLVPAGCLSPPRLSVRRPQA